MSRVWAHMVGAAALISAFAAMAIPAPTSSASTQIASVLLVGALALLAGHTWGLLIVAAADALLLGALWPVLAFPPTSTSTVLASVAIAGALPGLVLLGRTLPRTVDMVIRPRTERVRVAGVRTCSVLIGVWMLLPIL